MTGRLLRICEGKSQPSQSPRVCNLVVLGILSLGPVAFLPPEQSLTFTPPPWQQERLLFCTCLGSSLSAEAGDLGMSRAWAAVGRDATPGRDPFGQGRK